MATVYKIHPAIGIARGGGAVHRRRSPPARAALERMLAATKLIAGLFPEPKV
jgi:hypothetical protein